MLSNTVAIALREMIGEHAEETAKFVEYFDKFFDSLNVSSLSAGKLSRCAFKAPYRSDKDYRLRVCVSECMSCYTLRHIYLLSG